MIKGKLMSRGSLFKGILPFGRYRNEIQDFPGDKDPGFVLWTLRNIDLDENYGSLFSRGLETAEPVEFDEE